MNFSLKKHAKFSGRNGPVVILVCDGVGVAPKDPSNAVSEANTPNLDALMQQTHYTELLAHGTAVGLPSDDDMGNSEVGHNALGAGRIFAQGAKLVNESLADKGIFATKCWSQIISQSKNAQLKSTQLQDAQSQGTQLKEKNSTLHFLGLHSDGNIHSHTDHLYQLMEQAAVEGVKNCCLHLLLDGRDVPERSALEYIEETEERIAAINQRYQANFRIASGGGRMTITMDRYQADWDMVKRGWECHVLGKARQFASATEALTTLYSESNKGDQYLEAFVIAEAGEAVGKINAGDALVMFNFRGDRAMEISQAFENDDFDHFDRGFGNSQSNANPKPDVFYAGMLQYDGDELIPKNYLVKPPKIDKTMSEYLLGSGVHSFAISETQKYGHVTYFWNGNKSGYIEESMEEYIEIPSDNVPFNEAPAMKAREITEKTIELIESGKFGFGRLNLANGDMVGHTGDLAATIETIEVVDECIGKLMTAIKNAGGVLMVTADHGNADIMYTEKNGKRTPKTSHTLNKVPFAIVDPSYAGEYQLAAPDDAGLTHIAATTMNFLGFEAPENYQPSLLKFN